MTREHLIHQLQRHLPFTEEEAEMTRRLTAFVEAHPDCFERSLLIGHITSSAWILDLNRTHTLLTHHGKLDKWLQLGGHTDGNADVLDSALREAREESGVDHVTAITPDIFDVDIHLIPARKTEPQHYHYDVRFLLQADRAIPLKISSESKDLRWVPLNEVDQLTQEESVLRMLRKTRARFSQAAHS